jgi:signal transduction histidine kinase
VVYSFNLRKLVNANDAAFDLFEASKLYEFQTILNNLLDQKAESYPNFKRLITALANGKKEIEFECQLTTIKGKQIAVSFRYAVQPNDDNSLRRLFMTAFDLTAHNMAEEELKRYRNHLEELVKERTLELTRENTQRRMAESQLQKALKIEADLRKNSESQMAERILFTRALAHELKTPLTPLLAASEYLSTNLEGTPKEFAEAVSRGGRRLERRVNEFLDLSKGEIGLLELKHENVALDELLVALVADMRPAVQDRDQQLQLVTPGDLPVITGDHDRIEQVLLNLVNNAIKFNHQGGTITIKAECMNNEIVISVQDEGIGIDVQNMQHLFEPYKRSSNQDTLGGLGLGLALSKMLVELHGGRIWVESSLKAGMLVSFSLPLSVRPKRGIEKL